MSFDDYAHHIYQKHRLSVALAVLKTKPKDLTSTEYLMQLKSKMADNMADDDVTVCSDDFMMDFDDDSVNILDNFDVGEEFGNNGGNNTDGQANNLEDFSQATYYNTPQITQTTLNNTINNNILNLPSNTYTDQNLTYYDENQNNDNIKTTKLANKTTKAKLTETNSNKNNLDPIPNSTEATSINLNSQTNIDSEKTILYTVHGFTQNFTHYSPSQFNIFVPENQLYAGINSKNFNFDKNDTNNESATIDVNRAVNIVDLTNIGTKVNEIGCTKSIREESAQIDEDFVENLVLNDENAFKATFGHEFHSYFHENQIIIGSESTFKAYNDKNDENTRKFENSQQLNDNFDDIHNFNDITLAQTIQSEQNTHFHNQNIKNDIDIPKNDAVTDKIGKLPANIANNNTENLTADTNLIYNNDTARPFSKNLSQNYVPNIEMSIQNNMETEELIEGQSKEIISYKILEELNKVKMFLRRRDRRLSCDGYSTDSGYRSDSQRSSNRSALQLSGVSINQSAYCLFNHIIQCPLVETTRDITNDIAQTVAQLIDKLHEDESYPPFLEELLDTVDILLRQIYKGHNVDDDEFLKKEEFMQRLLLLNKSIHLQEHTIEKITIILTNFHQKVTDQNVTYELTNIDEIENSAYIFHLLEILIKKYILNKNFNTGNTQPSQEDEKILKKSSITDIWRKKWNPNLKIAEGSRENRCVLKKCSDILNKIVVECVSLYSVVAFAALKCFNCIQS